MYPKDGDDMNIKNKKNLVVIFSLLWMSTIFFLSSMNGTASNNKSYKMLEFSFKNTLKVTNKLNITHVNPRIKGSELALKYNYPLRKVAHATEYGILAIILIYIFKYKKINNKYYLSILCTFMYACVDEIHQKFTGRTSSFKDVLIDTTGCIIFLFIYYLIEKKRNKVNEKI